MIIVYYQVSKDWYSWGRCVEYYRRNLGELLEDRTNYLHMLYNIVILVILRLGLIILTECFSFVIILTTKLDEPGDLINFLQNFASVIIILEFDDFCMDTYLVKY